MEEGVRNINFESSDREIEDWLERCAIGRLRKIFILESIQVS